MTATLACAVCRDPTPPGWRYCRRCHRWHDLAVALRYAGSLGIDERRLHRALRYLLPKRPRFASPAMVQQLLRRIEQLEREVEGSLW